MIEVQHISKQFGEKFALHDVSFTLNKGEIVALIGENGAGKSTLMRIICGYIAPTSGCVSVSKHNIETERIQALKYIGYVPEISSLYSDMVVFDFLKWIAHLWNISNVNETILDVADKMQITEVLSNKIESLSKGFKKRVEIASALLHQPKVLILDEPTDGLDPNQKEHIRQFIKEYAKDNLVLISTHVLEDTSIANRALMLAAGKVIYDASMNDFKKISHSKNLTEAFQILTSSAKGKK